MARSRFKLMSESRYRLLGNQAESPASRIDAILNAIKSLRSESSADPGYGFGKGGGGAVGGGGGVSPVGKGPPKKPAGKAGRPPAPKK